MICTIRNTLVRPKTGLHFLRLQALKWRQYSEEILCLSFARSPFLFHNKYYSSTFTWLAYRYECICDYIIGGITTLGQMIHDYKIKLMIPFIHSTCSRPVLLSVYVLCYTIILITTWNNTGAHIQIVSSTYPWLWIIISDNVAAATTSYIYIAYNNFLSNTTIRQYIFIRSKSECVHYRMGFTFNAYSRHRQITTS